MDGTSYKSLYLPSSSFTSIKGNSYKIFLVYHLFQIPEKTKTGSRTDQIQIWSICVKVNPLESWHVCPNDTQTQLLDQIRNISGVCVRVPPPSKVGMSVLMTNSVVVQQ